MKLPHGKIPVDLLKEVVFKNLGAARKEVIVGPSAGVDSAVLEAGEKDLIVSMDPITGAVERIGWLAVNVNANDVATFGVEPAFLFSCLMLPEGSDRGTVEIITGQMSKAASELGMAIVGGHAETTPGLTHPIVVGCAIGVTPKGNYVTAANARAGDKIILTKSAGVEGTAILASDREKELLKTLSKEEIRSAQGFYSKISVVKDALTACAAGGVHAMHDPTEGGVAGGAHEMADAANLGIRILRDKVKVEPETDKICRHFGLDPLQLIGSGALLIAVESESAESIISALERKQVFAAIIGEFVRDKAERKLILESGERQALPRPASDHLWKALTQG